MSTGKIGPSGERADGPTQTKPPGPRIAGRKGKCHERRGPLPTEDRDRPRVLEYKKNGNLKAQIFSGYEQVNVTPRYNIFPTDEIGLKNPPRDTKISNKNEEKRRIYKFFTRREESRLSVPNLERNVASKKVWEYRQSNAFGENPKKSCLRTKKP